ncbi:hypothetical protein [Streptomyces sp. NBC_01373]|uniref:hypothetical protein n=1 Tax=Streptomyces sp. NBC_01373 TaxID=2903843 RepID=UPI002259B55A|nr:hypothetical protein [Streptomyces sp. NBC_01373]MCX4703859.1 hypothetical protein [Streptomyces sp. NBC_01373]
MADDVQITVHVRDLSGPGVRSVTRNLDQLQRQATAMGGSLRVVGGQLGNLSNAAANAGSSLGGGMGLKGQAISAGVALGSTLLPAIGAAAPMLVGFAAVGGGAALAMGDLKKKAKELKPAFQEWQKVAEKAVAPHTEKAVKSLKGAMKDLTPVIQTGAETFGRITEKAAAFADSPAFKGALAKNAEMGSKFVEEFAGSVMKFTQAFLDFGTKSQPALDAFQELFGGLLDTALPGMFEGLERGIGGSADIIGGLADMLNKVLPAFGRFSGELAKATGPLLAEGFKLLGSVAATALDGLGFGLRMAAPLMNDFAEGLRGLREVGGIIAPVLKDIGSALLSVVIPPGLGDVAGPFERMAKAIDQNRLVIQDAARAFGVGVLDMAGAAISSIPTIVGAFQGMSTMVLMAIDGLVSGAAAAFGGLPVIGDKFIEANKKFDKFKNGFLSGLDAAKQKTQDFADSALPKLEQGKLKLNINNWESQIATAKAQMKSVPPEKRAELKALIADLQAKVSAAKAQLNSVKGKSVTVKANTAPFSAAVGGIAGRVLGTSYINVQMRRVESNVQPKFSANGNIFRSFADGGTEDHTAQIAPAGAWRVWAEPETGGEAYIPLSPAKRPRSRQIAEETVGALGGAVKWFAKGGVTKAEQDARAGARGDLTVSHFGRMAGYQRSEIRSGLGNPDGVGALVNSLNQWASIIKKATHGAAEKNLLKALDIIGRKLLGYEKQLTSVTKSLESAKTKLNDLKSAASQLATSVKSGVLGSANITRGAAGDGPTTVASVMGGLTRSRDQSSAFAKALADLQKKGLSASLIQQIGEAGIEGGGLETAGALLNASSSEIKSMNSLQSQITKAATTAGKVTSDAVYAGQIKAQSVTVMRLERSQKALTAAMDRLAASMERTIEGAFAKKAAGGIVGAAASGGMRSGLTMVGEQGVELLDLPAGSRVWSNPDSRRKLAAAQAPWASMLNMPRGGGSRARAARGGGQVQPILVQQTITLDGRVIAQQIFDPLRAEIAHRGGSVQKSLGQGAG